MPSPAERDDLFTNQTFTQYHFIEPADQPSKVFRSPLQSSHSDTSYHGLSAEHEGGSLVHVGVPQFETAAARRQPNGFLRWWAPELVSTGFSLACLATLIAILRAYDGRSLGDLRLPPWLTLNGLIAFIATLNRVALVAPIEATLSQEAWLWFSSARQAANPQSRLVDLEISDRASRGAWGSLMFLFQGRGRWLSYIGSIIVIVSIFFGTFTQQVITFQNFAISPDDPTLPQAGNIPRSTFWANFTGNPAEGSSTTTLGFKAAIYNGVLTNSIKPVEVDCWTGNCTWPLTPSLAVCGGCHDVEYRTNCNETVCNYTLPDGNVATLGNFRENREYGVGFVAVSREALLNSTISKRLHLADFDVFGAPYNTYGFAWPNHSTVSAECSLWWCINSYSVTDQAGQQQSTTNNTFSNITYTFEGGWSGGDQFYFDALPASMNPTPGANYSVGIDATLVLQAVLAPLLNGNITLNLETQGFSSDFVQAIWNGTDNIDSWTKNLALSMTNYVRMANPVRHVLYDGTAYQLGIKVQWPWIILPTAMVFSSVLVLAWVMIESERNQVGVWKGSPLALLFTDVDPEIKGQVGPLEASQFKGIERAVGGRRVTLDTERGRMRFRAAG